MLTYTNWFKCERCTYRNYATVFSCVKLQQSPFHLVSNHNKDYRYWKRASYLHSKNYLQAKRYLGIVNTQDKNHLHLLYKVKKKPIKQVLHLIFKIKRNKLIFTLYAYKAARISQWRISRILLTWKGLFKCIALQITACFVFFSTEGLKWKHEG